MIILNLILMNSNLEVNRWCKYSVCHCEAETQGCSATTSSGSNPLDADAYESVEAFSPFLEDQDVWFRNKAIEAYRRWAPLHAPHLLEQLAQRGEVDGNDVSHPSLNPFKMFH